MLYNDIILKHFEQPLNTGVVYNATHIAMIGDMSSKSCIKLTAKVENNIIVDIKYKVYGGVALIACLSLLTQLLKGKTIQQALCLKSLDLSEMLHLNSSQYIYAIFAIDSVQNLFSVKQ